MASKQKAGETDDEYRARLRKYSKDYYWRHRDAQLAKSKKWKDDNHDYRLEYQRQYARAHKDRMTENHRRWRAAHPERDKANRDEYAKVNRLPLKVSRALGISVDEARKQLEADT